MRKSVREEGTPGQHQCEQSSLQRRQAKCLQQVEQVRACLDQDGAILIHVFAPERHPLRPRVAESLQLKAPLALIWWKSLIVRKLDLPLA